MMRMGLVCSEDVAMYLGSSKATVSVEVLAIKCEEGNKRVRTSMMGIAKC